MLRGDAVGGMMDGKRCKKRIMRSSTRTKLSLKAVLIILPEDGLADDSDVSNLCSAHLAKV